jgi:chromosome segregation ATPase
METVFIVASAVLSLLAVVASIVAAKKFAGAAGKDQIDTLRAESAQLESALSGSLTGGESRFSKAQLSQLIQQTEEFVQALDSQKQVIKELESKLEQAQKDVELKEGEQQEMKSSKEEDEKRLAEITAGYETFSSQSVALEHKLAASLKNLDTLMAEVPMTADQKAVFQELSNTLTSSSSRLRDLFVDYQAVHERLEGLKSQHTDLEEEYTKLVEQQLSV